MTIETDPTQFGAYGYNQEAIRGLLYGLDAHSRVVESYAAGETIPMGSGLFVYEGDDTTVYLPHLDQAKLVYSGDFVSLNNVQVFVNGLEANVVFNTNQLTTMNDLIAAIDALDSTYATALDPADANDRTLLITTKGADAVATSTVTLGASQATVVITQQDSDLLVFAGVAIRIAQEPEEFNSRGDNYIVNQTVSVLVKGFIWAIKDATTIVVNTAPRIILSGTDTGKFSANSNTTNTQLLAGYYKTLDVSDTLVVVQVDAQTKIA